MTPQTAFLESVVAQAGIDLPKPRIRYCTKHRGYSSDIGSSGTGRQYRCAKCTEQRRAAMARRVLEAA